MKAERRRLGHEYNIVTTPHRLDHWAGRPGRRIKENKLCRRRGAFDGANQSRDHDFSHVQPALHKSHALGPSRLDRTDGALDVANGHIRTDAHATTAAMTQFGEDEDTPAHQGQRVEKAE